MQLFDNKHVLITGGTGSLGTALLRRLLSGEKGTPYRITIFSRDEAKQDALRSAHAGNEKFKDIVRFRIGDVRDYASIASALDRVDIVFNTAALKQVPSCEYFPYEAVQTNIQGAENIVRAISERFLMVGTVVGISTDKACKPVNVMGMTKAIQERIFLHAGERCPVTKFVCVRYGNVLASRGSVIPLFKEQIKKGGPVTVTTKEMTRFLMTLDRAVDTIFLAADFGQSGETFIPIIPSARVMDVAHNLIGCRATEIKVTGVRPGEKTHEILVSEEELLRTVYLKNSDGKRYFIIKSVLENNQAVSALSLEFSSETSLMTYDALTCLLFDEGFLND